MSNQKSLSRLAIHFRSAQRLLLWHCLSKKLPLYPVTEFPKCGGTWFCQMLSDLLELPFARNMSKPIFKRSIIHGHHMYSSRFYRPITVIRDGRDAIVSAYYHFLFRNEVNSNYGVNRTRAALQFKDYDDIETNLPEFIDYMFTTFGDGLLRFTWSEFIDDWHDKERLEIRYEDLLKQPAVELLRAADWCGETSITIEQCEKVAENYTFKKMSGRASGEDKPTSFLRKGIAGDWVNVFSPEAKKRFHHYAGQALIRAGYESDNSWLDSETPDNTGPQLQNVPSN